MPNQPAAKPGRLTFLVAICSGLAALLILAVLAVESTGPLDTALWHTHHGSTVTYDGHLFHLPLSWYPDPNSNPGQLTLQHARFGAVDASRITLAIEPRTLNDEAATSSIAAITAHLNQPGSTPSPQWTTETLRSRSLTFRCATSAADGADETLICQGVDSNLRILIMSAGASTRTDALSILETSE